MPGRTPIAVPKVTPNAASSKYCGVSALAKPCSRLVKTSILGPSQDACEYTRRQPDAENAGEDQVNGKPKCQSYDDVAPQPGAPQDARAYWKEESGSQRITQ